MLAAAHAIWRVSLLGVARGHDRLDVSADVEIADHLHEAWVVQANQVIQDTVDGSLVEHLLVAELVDVQLERLELHQLAVRDVSNADGGEVGKVGLRTKAGEFGNREVDLVVT